MMKLCVLASSDNIQSQLQSTKRSDQNVCKDKHEEQMPDQNKCVANARANNQPRARSVPRPRRAASHRDGAVVVPRLRCQREHEARHVLPGDGRADGAEK